MAETPAPTPIDPARPRRFRLALTRSTILLAIALLAAALLTAGSLVATAP